MLCLFLLDFKCDDRDVPSTSRKWIHYTSISTEALTAEDGKKEGNTNKETSLLPISTETNKNKVKVRVLVVDNIMKCGDFVKTFTSSKTIPKLRVCNRESASMS